MLVLFVVTQVLRVWTLASIGRWWTTRIISAPHFDRVKRGPYKYISHPNYLVVVLEIAIVPLMLGLPWVALVFYHLEFYNLYEGKLGGVATCRDWQRS